MSKPNIKHKVSQTPEQRQRLKDVSRNGHAPAKKVLHEIRFEVVSAYPALIE